MRWVVFWHLEKFKSNTTDPEDIVNWVAQFFAEMSWIR